MGFKSTIGRLIPLNKNFPNVPEISDYRPIVVLSPLIKCI